MEDEWTTQKSLTKYELEVKELGVLYKLGGKIQGIMNRDRAMCEAYTEVCTQGIRTYRKHSFQKELATLRECLRLNMTATPAVFVGVTRL